LIKELDHILTAYGIAHTFETYDGMQISGMQDRVEKKVVPFFSKNLSFGRAGR
jgi:S-formylglutathione hydrolase